MKTRDRILQGSLTLFNRRGERNVSTNHIAAELGISPGNLYYHFRNKQDIVFELFKAYAEDVDRFMSVPDDRELTFADKVVYFESTFKSIWEYRFLHRDLGHLLEGDENLHQAYRAFTQRTLHNGRAVLTGLREAGLIAIDDEQMDALMINIWVLVTSWASFLQAVSPVDEQDEAVSEMKIKRGIYQLIALTEPFAVPGHEADVQALKKAYLGDQLTDPFNLID